MTDNAEVGRQQGQQQQPAWAAKQLLKKQNKTKKNTSHVIDEASVLVCLTPVVTIYIITAHDVSDIFRSKS